MRNIKIILFSAFLSGWLLCWQNAAAQDIRIGLFENELVSRFTLHCTNGNYNVISSGKTVISIQAGYLLYISLTDDRLSVHDGNLNYGLYEHLHFDDIYKNGEFRIKLVEPDSEARNYEGDLEIKAQNSAIQIINQLPLDNYLAGVVEAEGGPAAPQEYYKAQAVISRTYALMYWNKHDSQDFNLCDDLHCQVYKGISDESDLIFESVLFTHNLVVNNKNYKLINTPFHSNSGGETQRASDVWIEDEENLQAVLDPFSEEQRNAKWTSDLSLDDWRKYIFSKITGDTTKLSDESLMIKQQHRRKHFIVGKDTFLLGNIRKDMGFRSTFFNMELKGDRVLISGKGYGHGVGMSQEGAMEMARKGYSFSDILRFYYHNIEISDLNELPASELPEPFR